MLRDIAKYVLLRTAAQLMGTCRRNLAYLATSPHYAPPPPARETPPFRPPAIASSGGRPGNTPPAAYAFSDSVTSTWHSAPLGSVTASRR